MANRRYSSTGRYLGRTETEADRRRNAEAMRGFARWYVVLTLYGPIAYPGGMLFLHLRDDFHIRPIYAGLAVGIPTALVLLAVWRSRTMRKIYFGILALVFIVLVYRSVPDTSDQPASATAAS